MSKPVKPLSCGACGLRLGDHDLRCQNCGADVRLWVRRGEQVWGPFDLARVREGRAEGRIVASDELAVGNGSWTPVGELSLAAAVQVRPRSAVPSSVALKWCLRILLVSVLLAAGSVGWGWHVLSRARSDMRCRQNLQAVWAAMQAYRLDHDQLPAPTADLPAKLTPYLTPSEEWWTCPRSGEPYVVGATPGGGLAVWDGRAGKRGPHAGHVYVVGEKGLERAEQAPGEGTVVSGLIAEDTSRTELQPAPIPQAPPAPTPPEAEPPTGAPRAAEPPPAVAPSEVQPAAPGPVEVPAGSEPRGQPERSGETGPVHGTQEWR